MKHSVLVAVLLALVARVDPAAANDRLAAADKLLLRGTYQEAAAAFEGLRSELPTQAALGLARVYGEQGQLAEAEAALAALGERAVNSADVLCEQAELDLRRGRLDAAAGRIRAALAVDRGHCYARWLESETLRLAEKIDEASQAYRWFAAEWDRRGRQIVAPRELRWLALGLAQHARWNRDATRFPQLVGEVLARAAELDADYWPAHFETGCLLAEKFNEADAAEAFAAALRINPRAAEVHAAVAQLALGKFELDEARRHVTLALKTDPNCLPARWARADLAFASLEPRAAAKALAEARARNPVSDETLGRLAAAAELMQPEGSDGDLDADALTAEVQRRHPHAGEFHAAWANALELSRRYRAAGEQFDRSVKLVPQLVGPLGRRGLIEMREGRERTARRTLQEAFAADPYNLRVKNQLEVLDLLQEYSTVVTEHFIVRFDAKQDGHLGPCVAEFAEATHAELAEEFGYELPRRAVLEIFSPAHGHSGAEWFGVRMVGLPTIHTIAACGGNVVALISPGTGRQRLNWADVMRHEMVHLFNIQQTDYAVPHWFTEGCAVWLEGRPRRDAWNRLLVERADRGELFDLASLDQAFLRPRTGDDWQLAYCQAELYLETLIDEHGAEAPRRMLEAFAANRSTTDALEDAFGITTNELEAAYRRSLQVNLDELRARRAYRAEADLDELEAQHAAKPDDAMAAARLAMARLRAGEFEAAGKLAREALERDPNQALARLVRARLLVRIGEDQAALDALATVVKAEDPPPEAIETVAGIHLRRRDLEEAARWYDRGAALEPNELSWTKAQAVVAVKQRNSERLDPLLEKVARAEPDNLLVRKKLLKLATARNDWQAIARWADEVLHIDAEDLNAHRSLAAAAAKLGQTHRAALHEKLAARAR